MNVNGQWFFESDKGSPCAIIQVVSILVLINEHGAIAGGKIIDNSTIIALQGPGWAPNLVGEVSPDEKQIAWKNGTTWRR
jgi:hypothetical protein